MVTGDGRTKVLVAPREWDAAWLDRWPTTHWPTADGQLPMANSFSQDQRGKSRALTLSQG